MAKKVNVTLTDDLDGETPADTTIEFAVDNINYEIDLSYANAEKMRESFATWVNHARKTGGNTRPRRTANRTPKEELAPIRTWAHSQGIKVSPRGRIPADVVKKFWERDKTTTVAGKAKSRRVAAALDKVEAALP